MLDYILEYVRKALSLKNRKPFDGDSNSPYRVVVEMAEVGEFTALGGDKCEPGFWFEIRIPRQVDNCLGCTIEQTTGDRAEAVALLKELIAELERPYRD